MDTNIIMCGLLYSMLPYRRLIRKKKEDRIHSNNREVMRIQNKQNRQTYMYV